MVLKQKHLKAIAIHAQWEVIYIKKLMNVEFVQKELMQNLVPQNVENVLLVLILLLLSWGQKLAFLVNQENILKKEVLLVQNAQQELFLVQALHFAIVAL
jgi:hypothetical protein